jgi:ABC-type multidrug transport system fused ATPase/permease subunit
MNEFYRLEQVIQKVDQARVKEVNKLGKAIESISKSQAEAIAQQQMEAIKEIIAHTYGKAQSYANVIIVAGYAAFFTMWASVKSDLPTIPMLISGLLMTISILLFVITEIITMLSTSRYFRTLQEKLAQMPSLDVLKEIKEAEKQNAQSQYHTWAILFYPSLLTGVISGIILCGCFIARLLTEFSM